MNDDRIIREYRSRCFIVRCRGSWIRMIELPTDFFAIGGTAMRYRTTKSLFTSAFLLGLHPRLTSVTYVSIPAGFPRNPPGFSPSSPSRARARAAV